MAQTKINANQTSITASDIGAASTAQLNNKQNILQYETLPTASADELGNIYQFVGTTDANYTNGYFYKCVSDGAATPTYSWSRVDIQPQGATYTAGTGIDITNGTISVTAPTLQNTATGAYSVSIAGTASTSYGTVNIGVSSNTTGAYGIAIGHNTIAKGISIGYESKTTDSNNIAIGQTAQITSGQGSICIGGWTKTAYSRSIQLGIWLTSGAVDTILIGFGQNSGNPATNAESGTMAVALRKNDVSVTYKLLDYDGTIPEARLADTTNAAQGDVLTLDSNLNAVWTACADFVIEFQAPTAQNDYTWYRKYKSGWVEQGGQIPSTTATSASETVNLPITMTDTNYFACGNTGYTGNDAPNYGGVVKSKTTTTITVGHLVNYTTNWMVSGISAEQ